MATFTKLILWKKDNNPEQIYKEGLNNLFESFKKGGKKKPRIYIKPQNRGKFTEYCKSKGYKGVTSKCIAEGKQSTKASIRKQATFAANARTWNKSSK